MTEGGREAVRADDEVVASAQVRALENRIRELERVLGKSSPQSNGMSEAFVKTFKCDYVYVHDRPDAQTVLAQLSRWFEDYNDNHPHKALRMKSPREFIRSYQPAACPVG